MLRLRSQAIMQEILEVKAEWSTLILPSCAQDKSASSQHSQPMWLYLAIWNSMGVLHIKSVRVHSVKIANCFSASQKTFTHLMVKFHYTIIHQVKYHWVPLCESFLYAEMITFQVRVKCHITCSYPLQFSFCSDPRQDTKFTTLEDPYSPS